MELLEPSWQRPKSRTQWKHSCASCLRTSRARTLAKTSMSTIRGLFHTVQKPKKTPAQDTRMQIQGIHCVRVLLLCTQ